MGVRIPHGKGAISCRDRVSALLVDEMAAKRSLNNDQLNDVVIGYEDFRPSLGKWKHIVTSALVFVVRGLALNCLLYCGCTHPTNSGKKMGRRHSSQT